MSESLVESVVVKQQIAVFVDDKPGSLSAVTTLLGRHGVNIYALSLAEGVGHGYVRMVVDRPDEALRVFKDAEELTIVRDVILVELGSRTGALGWMTGKLAEAGINLEYAYCAGGPSMDKGVIVIRVNDTAKALKVLQGQMKG